MLKNKFARNVVALVATTACVIGVLLVTAQNPSGDEFTRGGAAGVIVWMATKLFCKNGEKP